MTGASGDTRRGSPQRPGLKSANVPARRVRTCSTPLDEYAPSSKAPVSVGVVTGSTATHTLPSVENPTTPSAGAAYATSTGHGSDDDGDRPSATPVPAMSGTPSNGSSDTVA